MSWEPLINSGRAGLRVKITRFKARIAGNSPAIAKIRNAEAGDFGLRAAGHELIRGSLRNLLHLDTSNQVPCDRVAAPSAAPSRRIVAIPGYGRFKSSRRG